MSATRHPLPHQAWFPEARFGLFLHWGLYALLGRGEWAINRERIPFADYEPLKDQFTAEAYDPADWARTARAAGMKYVILTTKHHDGFCLWDSKLCPFNAVNSAAGRDLLAAFVEAVRAEGLKVGLYYSLGDFRNEDWRLGYEGDAEARTRFMGWTHGMVRELMTGYGKIDILWYDLPQNYSAEEWRSAELNAMARELQPGILINNRAMTPEDFGTPEQHVTAGPEGRLWEACMTLNSTWGYSYSDNNYKSPQVVALNLLKVAQGNGNLLLNVGPDPVGRLPAPAVGILQQVGRWLAVNGEALDNLDPNPLSWNLWGPTAVRGHTLYCFLSQYFGGTLTIGGLIPQVKEARLLGYPGPLRVERRETQTRIHGLPPAAHNALPVLRLDLDGPPEQDFPKVIGGADIFPDFPN
ncbi:MAG: alpha-L-fucosidase [Opitutales bacterium]